MNFYDYENVLRMVHNVTLNTPYKDNLILRLYSILPFLDMLALRRYFYDKHGLVPRNWASFPSPFREMNEILTRMHLDKKYLVKELRQQPLEKALSRRKHKKKLSSILKSRAAKQDFLEELGYMPPIYQINFPGGDRYRRTSTRFERSRKNRSRLYGKAKRRRRSKRRRSKRRRSRSRT